MKPAIALATLLLALSLTACSEDKPAVCSSVDDLKTSVADVKDIDVTSSSALTDFQSGLTAVQNNLADVKADAKSQFASPLAAAETSYAALESSVQAATTNPIGYDPGRGRFGAVHVRHRRPGPDQRHRRDLLSLTGSTAEYGVPSVTAGAAVRRITLSPYADPATWSASPRGRAPWTSPGSCPPPRAWRRLGSAIRVTSRFNPNERMSMLLEPMTARSSSMVMCLACRMYGAG